MIEELDVAVLHVLLILLQCAPSIAIRCEADVSLSTGSAARGSVTICASVIFVSPPVIVVVDHHVHRVGHGAEPLGNLLLGDSEVTAVTTVLMTAW